MIIAKLLAIGLLAYGSLASGKKHEITKLDLSGLSTMQRTYQLYGYGATEDGYATGPYHYMRDSMDGAPVNPNEYYSRFLRLGANYMPRIETRLKIFGHHFRPFKKVVHWVGGKIKKRKCRKHPSKCIPNFGLNGGDNNGGNGGGNGGVRSYDNGAALKAAAETHREITEARDEIESNQKHLAAEIEDQMHHDFRELSDQMHDINRKISDLDDDLKRDTERILDELKHIEDEIERAEKMRNVQDIKDHYYDHHSTIMTMANSYNNMASNLNNTDLFHQFATDCDKTDLHEEADAIKRWFQETMVPDRLVKNTNKNEQMYNNFLNTVVGDYMQAMHIGMACHGVKKLQKSTLSLYANNYANNFDDIDDMFFNTANTNFFMDTSSQFSAEVLKAYAKASDAQQQLQYVFPYHAWAQINPTQSTGVVYAANAGPSKTYDKSGYHVINSNAISMWFEQPVTDPSWKNALASYLNQTQCCSSPQKSACGDELYTCPPAAVAKCLAEGANAAISTAMPGVSVAYVHAYTISCPTAGNVYKFTEDQAHLGDASCMYFNPYNDYRMAGVVCLHDTTED